VSLLQLSPSSESRHKKTKKRLAIQRYKCNSCLRYFIERKIKKTEYPEKIILNSISAYNLGYTLEQTKKEMARRFHIKIPTSTINS